MKSAPYGDKNRHRNYRDWIHTRCHCEDVPINRDDVAISTASLSPRVRSGKHSALFPQTRHAVSLHTAIRRVIPGSDRESPKNRLYCRGGFETRPPRHSRLATNLSSNSLLSIDSLSRMSGVNREERREVRVNTSKT